LIEKKTWLVVFTQSFRKSFSSPHIRVKRRKYGSNSLRRDVPHAPQGVVREAGSLGYLPPKQDPLLSYDFEKPGALMAYI
jgi:hypothetical protein